MNARDTTQHKAGPGVEAGRRRGRGAATNPAPRFDTLVPEPEADGWTPEPADPLRTEVSIEKARTILTRNRSPDVPFDRSVNPYRGCEHGCTYCFARPSHAYLGLSPGLDFETRLSVKPEAAALLARALGKTGYRPAPIAMGTNTDPYQPIEKTWRLMPGILDVLWTHRHPLMLTTKGTLITRDLDVLGRMGRAGLLRVSISLTTLDPRLSRAMEPRAASPGRRIAMVRALAKAGVPTGIKIAPIIPGLNDTEIERLIQAGAEAGADHANYIVLRLPLEVAPLFREWLGRAYPDRAAKVMRAVRELHGGRDYDPAWGKRMLGEGVHARLIARRFALSAARFGLDRAVPVPRSDLFRVPDGPGRQLSLGI